MYNTEKPGGGNKKVGLAESFSDIEAPTHRWFKYYDMGDGTGGIAPVEDLYDRFTITDDGMPQMDFLNKSDYENFGMEYPNYEHDFPTSIDPDSYMEQLYKFSNDYSDWFYNKRGKKKLQLIPMTEDDAHKESLQWFPTTDDYIKALVETGVVANEDILRQEAQKALYNILREDIKNDRHEYDTALRNRFLDRTGNEEITPADTTVIDQTQKPRLPNPVPIARVFTDMPTKREFEEYPFEQVLASNMVIPMTSHALYNPEYKYRTTPLGWGARLAGDAVTDAALAVAPELIGTRVALRTGIGSGKSGMLRGLSQAGIRAGSGAATHGADWALNNLVIEPLAYNSTGEGISNAPADLRDMALQATLGGLTNAAVLPFYRAGKLDKAMDIRRRMSPKNPDEVTYKDIKDSFGMFKSKKVDPSSGSKITSEEITNLKATPEVKKQFANMAYKDYDAKYPMSAQQVVMAPELKLKEVGRELTPTSDYEINYTISPVMDRPSQGKLNKGLFKTMTAKEGSPYAGYELGSGMELADKSNRLHSGTASKGKRKTEYELVGPDKKVLLEGGKGDYDVLLLNPDKRFYLDYKKATGLDDIIPVEHNEDFIELADAATRLDGENAKRLFSGKTEVIPQREYNKALGMYLKSSDNTPNTAATDILTKRATVGNLDKETGKFVKADKKQRKALKKAEATKQKRLQMNLVSTADLTKGTNFENHLMEQILKAKNNRGATLTLPIRFGINNWNISNSDLVDNPTIPYIYEE